MSLIPPKKYDVAIFDIPNNKDIYKSEFVDRRIITIAGKAVFSEKNIPTKPSTDYKYRKCFVLNKNNLYKNNYDKTIKDLKRIKIDLILDKEKIYLFPLNYHFYYGKLRQKKTDYYSINTYKFNKVIRTKTNTFNRSLNSANSWYKPLVYSDDFKIVSLYKFSLENNNFKPIIYETLATHNLLFSNKVSLIKTKTRFKDEFGTINYFDKAITNDSVVLGFGPVHKSQRILGHLLMYGFFNDIAMFSKSRRDKMICINSFKEMNLINTHNNITKEFDSSYIYYFKQVYHYLTTLKSIFNPILEKFFENERSSKKFISYNSKLLVADNNFYINNRVCFYLDISNFITNPNVRSFATRKININIHEGYKKCNIKINYKRFDINSFSSFKLCIKTNKRDVKSSREESVIRNVPSSILLKYKQPRIALKLKLFKPKFNDINPSCLMHDKRVQQNKIKDLLNIKIKAKYDEVKFNHKSPLKFESKIKTNDLTVYKLFKLKRSRFFNKCPKYAKYQYKSTHAIIFENSFRKSKKVKFAVKSFIVKCSATKNKTELFFPYVYKALVKAKEIYIYKTLFNKISQNRVDIRQILFDNKFRTIKKKKTPTDFMTARKRIGVKHIQRLSIIKTEVLTEKGSYNWAYVSPYKRIIPGRNQIPLDVCCFKLEVIKDSDEIYSNKNRITDNFQMKFTKDKYFYTAYLPKQIIPSINFCLKIISIGIIKTLKQKDFIPPPAWEKQKRGFVCKLKLGPYPFGFPDFYFSPPVFVDLLTKEEYGIKDTTIENIQRVSRLIFKKDKLYLPELSMKSPRRFLYSGITPQNSPKEYYKNKNIKQNLNLNKPEIINYFDFYLHNDFKKILSNNKHIYNTNNISNRRWIFKYAKIKLETEYIDNNNFSKISNVFMPIISLFTLKSDSFVIKNNKVEIEQKVNIKKIFAKINDKKPFIGKPKLIYKELKCCLNNKKVLLFTFIFPKSYEVENYCPSYKSRFRSFHFPYKPLLDLGIDEKLGYKDFIDDKDCFYCKYQDDFRVSEFDFNDFEINDFNKDEYKIVKNKADYRLDNVCFNYKTYEKYLESEYAEYSENVFIYNSIENPDYYCQHIIPSNFYDAKVAFRYKFKRRHTVLSTLKSFKISKFDIEEYWDRSLYGNGYFMELSSAHMIILLRKNDCLHSICDYIYNKGLVDCFELQSGYKSVKLENEKYNLDCIAGSTLTFNLDYKFTEIDKLINILSFSVYNYNNDFLISEKSLIDDIKMLSVSNNLNNSFEDEKYQDFRFQISITSKEMINDEIDRINSQLNEEKHDEFHVINIKYLRDIFSVDANRENKSMPYRPINIPDFIDIKEEKTIKLKLWSQPLFVEPV